MRFVIEFHDNPTTGSKAVGGGGGAVLPPLPESEPPGAFADKPLTATERKIIIALSRRPSRVFTRDELIAVAFDDEFDGYDRVIDTHIKNLRKKIGSDCIKTVHGLGYQWGGMA